LPEQLRVGTPCFDIALFQVNFGGLKREAHDGFYTSFDTELKSNGLG